MGKPTITMLTMQQCYIMDIITTDNYRVSLRASIRQGRRFKSISQLLGLLCPDVTRIRADYPVAHLLGENAVDSDTLQNREIFDDLSNRLHDHFWKTLGLKKSKKVLKWNLHLDVVVTNTEGIVVYERTTLWWTGNTIHDFLKHGREWRKATDSSEVIRTLSYRSNDLIEHQPK